MARNAKPTLTTTNQSFIEDQVQTNFSSSGSLWVTDTDLNQTLTAYISRASLSFSGGALSRSQTQALSTALVEGKLAFDNTVLSGGASTEPINFSWNPDDVNLDFMTEGQSLTITYKIYVSDGGAKSAVQDLTFTITGANDAPSAVADTLDAIEDTPATYLVSTLLANDSDPDSPTLTLTGVTNGIGGTVAFSGDAITFTPDANFYGPATFSYTASDGSLSSVGTVTVNVAPVNDAPVAVDDTLDAIEDTQVTYPAGALTGNDTDPDPDGPALTIASVTNGTNGTAALNADGTVTFTPDPNFNGPATFTYTISDGTLISTPATVTVNVAPVNDAPVAIDDTLDATEDTAVTYAAAAFLANDTDPDSPTLTIASVTNGANGTAVLNADSTVTFKPDTNFYGPATFSYTVTDGNSNSAPATVTVNVAPVNDAPVAINDSLDAIEDTPVTYAAGVLTANDIDPDGPPLTIASVTNGIGGTVALNGDAITFTPDANFYGPATFSYTVSDGSPSSAPATVTVNVAAVNDAPTTSPVTLGAIAEDGGPRLITQAELLVKASDVDNASLTATGLAIVAGAGSLAANDDGTWTYTAALNDDTSVSFSYTITDNGTTNGSPDPKSVAGSATLDITPVADNIYAPFVSWTTANPEGIMFVAEDLDGPALGYADPFSDFGHVDNGTMTVFTPLVQPNLVAGDLSITDGEFQADVGFEVVLGTNGDDIFTLSAPSGNPTLMHGFDGNDVIAGSESIAIDDILVGGDGDDMLAGGAGDDRLFGGTGADRLTGGDGSDQFVFQQFESTLLVTPPLVAGYDTITDFTLFTESGIFDTIWMPGSVLAAEMATAGIGTARIFAHQVDARGVITFLGAGLEGLGEFQIFDQASLAEAVQYLTTNNLMEATGGDVGATVAFTGSIDDSNHTWLYMEGEIPDATFDDTLVDLVGVTATGIRGTGSLFGPMAGDILVIG